MGFLYVMKCFLLDPRIFFSSLRKNNVVKQKLGEEEFSRWQLSRER